MRAALLTAMFSVVALANDAQAQWQYKSSHDQMRNETSTVARLESINEHPVGLGRRKTKLDLVIRERKQDGLNIFLASEHGVISCNMFNGCAIWVKFDTDQKPAQVRVVEAEADRARTLFFGDEKSILKRIRASKTMMVELVYYGDGARQFEFNTGGLTWPSTPPLAASKK